MGKGIVMITFVYNENSFEVFDISNRTRSAYLAKIHDTEWPIITVG